jgi:hypothetical protein
MWILNNYFHKICLLTVCTLAHFFRPLFCSGKKYTESPEMPLKSPKSRLGRPHLPGMKEKRPVEVIFHPAYRTNLLSRRNGGPQAVTGANFTLKQINSL